MSVESSIENLKKVITDLESEIKNKENESQFSDSRNRIVHEHSLINNRINWMLTSQTIFFGIYAMLITDTGISNDKYGYFVDLIPWLSLVTGVLIYVSILAAILAIRKFTKDSGDETMIGFIETYRAGLVTPIFLPWFFIMAWVYIICHNYYLLLAISILIALVIGFLFHKTNFRN